MSNNKTAYLLCSPSLGLLDSWLPVINELKIRYEYKFICIIPKAGTAELIKDNDVVVKISENLFDEVYFLSQEGHWCRSQSFYSARDLTQVSAIKTLSRKVMSKIERVLKSPHIFKPIKNIFSLLEQIKLQSIKIDLEEVVKEDSFLLYDIGEEYKGYNQSIVSLFKGKKKFSIPHGLNIDTNEIINYGNNGKGQGETLAFLFSEVEHDYYTKSFSLDTSDQKVVGVARHNDEWMKELNRYSSLEKDWNNYLFIISRPLSPYFPLSRKKKTLEEIKELIIEKSNMKVVVKKHPKERDEGLYEEVFGKDNLGKTWIESVAHPFIIGSSCKFALSFYSGVPVDLISLKIPVVEYLDLKGLAEFDNEKSLRDHNGEPIFSYRSLGLVHGVSSKEELSTAVEKLLEDKTEISDKLKKNYDKLYKQNNPAKDVIAEEIYKRVN